MTRHCKFWFIALFLTTALSLSAQDSPDKNKIKSLKIAFITERLDLSASEAEMFWPLYNTYEMKRDELRDRQHREVFDKISSVGSMSEVESRELLKKYLAIETEEEALDSNFYKQVADAISAKKTLLLFRAEHDFRRQLIRQMQQHKGSRGN